MQCDTSKCPLLRGKNVTCEAYRVYGNLQDAILSNFCQHCPMKASAHSALRQISRKIHRQKESVASEASADTHAIPV